MRNANNAKDSVNKATKMTAKNKFCTRVISKAIEIKLKSKQNHNRKTWEVQRTKKVQKLKTVQILFGCCNITIAMM